MVNEYGSSKLPKFFSMIPFWIWPLLGLVCLALSVPGFMAVLDRNERQEALSNPVPALIDLEDFDTASDTGLAGEVNIFAQTSPDYRFLVDATGLTGGSGYIVPLFSAVAGPKEKSVQHVLFVRDLERFEPWLEENAIGTARMGALYEINGEVVDGRGFTAVMRVTLRDAGLEQTDPLTIVQPFLDGRQVGLSQSNITTFGNPFVLVASGLWMVWFGFVVGSRAKRLKHSVSRRIGEIEDRSTSGKEENKSRLKRSSSKLSAARAAQSGKTDLLSPEPKITPAE